MKNAFNGLIGRLDMTEERIYEPEDKAIEISQTWKPKRSKTLKNNNNNTEYPKG